MIPGVDDLVVRRNTARFRGRRFPCRIGRSGATNHKREGDGSTPTGIHRAEYVLYRPDRIRAPATRLPLRPVRHHDGWSDDPADSAYNTAVWRPRQYGSEALWLPSRVYDLIVVLDWNRDPSIAGRGSAIFLHVMDSLGRPTAGCVSLEQPTLLFVLKTWQPWSRLIVEQPGTDSSP